MGSLGAYSIAAQPSAWRIAGLLSQLGTIDTERNVLFEADYAGAAVRAGGAIVVDGIDLSRGFRSFTDTVSDYQSLIADANPLEPDLTRFAGMGLFGVIFKSAFFIR